MMLPAPIEIEQCLQEATDQQFSSADRRLDLRDCEVLRTVLISGAANSSADTEEMEAFAVVSQGGGRCLLVGGHEVQLVTRETPAGQWMLGCNVGDTSHLGRVAAVDSRLTRKAEERQRSAQVQAEQAARCQQARLEKGRQQAAERKSAECQEQEAFDRRAAAHFLRSEDLAAKDRAAAGLPKKTKKALHKLAEAQQLKWPI